MSSQNSKKIPIKTIHKINYKNRSNDLIENISKSTLFPFESVIIENDNFKLKSTPMLLKKNKFKKLLNNVLNLSSYINCASHLNSIDANLLNSLNVINNNNNENTLKNFNQVLSDGIHNIYFSNKNNHDDENLNEKNNLNLYDIITNINDINPNINNKNQKQKNIFTSENDYISDLKKSKIISEKIQEKKEKVEIMQLQLKKLIKMRNNLKENINKKSKSKSREKKSHLPEKNLKHINKKLNPKVNQEKNNFNSKKNQKEMLLKLKKNIEKIRINSEESSSFEKNDEKLPNNLLNIELKNSKLNSHENSIKESQIKQLSQSKKIENKSFDIIDSYLD